MALDEAIFESVAHHHQPPTLRLYSWYPYCLSLGHAQPISDINQKKINLSGWGLVRRPTGGRAILHADELTYSICAPVNDPRVQGGVIESYRRISDALLLMLKKIGIKADSKPKDQEKKHLSKDPVCFQYPSDYEITFGGKKIVGSAQARRSNALLQHGSVPLFGDITRILSVLVLESTITTKNTVENLKSRASTLEEALGQRVSWNTAARALSQSIEEKFGVLLIQQPIADDEFSNAKELLREKYSHPSWTERV